MDRCNTMNSRGRLLGERRNVPDSPQIANDFAGSFHRAPGGTNHDIQTRHLLVMTYSNIGVLYHMSRAQAEAMEHYQMALGETMAVINGGKMNNQEGECSGEGEGEVRGSNQPLHRRLAEALAEEDRLLRLHHGEAGVTASANGVGLTVRSNQLTVELYRPTSQDPPMDEWVVEDGGDNAAGIALSPLFVKRCHNRALPPHTLNNGNDDDEEARFGIDSAVTLYNLALWYLTFGQGKQSSDTAMQLLKMGLSVCPKASVNITENDSAALTACSREGRYHTHMHEHFPRRQQLPQEPQTQVQASSDAVLFDVTALIHATIGQIHLDAERPGDAIPHLIRSWAVASLTTSGDVGSGTNCQGVPRSSLLVATVLSRLGHAHYRRSEMRHALSACQAVLHLLQKSFSIATPGDAISIRKATARALHNTATVQIQCGETDRAIAQYSAFLSLHEDDNNLRAQTLHSIGRAHLFLSDHARAVCPLRDAVSLTYRLCGNTEAHPSLIPILDSLGCAYLGQGLLPNALCTFQRAYSIVQRTTGHRSMNAATQLCNVGHVFRMGGNFEEAVKCYRDALDVVEELSESADEEDSPIDDDAAWPSPTPPLVDLLEMEVKLLRILGNAQWESGDVVAASVSFREGLELQATLPSGVNLSPIGLDVTSTIFQTNNKDHPPSAAAA